MAKPERPRRRMLLIAGVGVATVSYVAISACGSNPSDVRAPLEPVEAGPIADPTMGGGYIDAGGGSNGSTSSGLATAPTTSASQLKPYTDPTTSVPKTTKPPPHPTGGNLAPPPTHTATPDSPVPGRHH